MVSDFRETTLSRASFEMQCPQQQLTVEDLTPQEEAAAGSQMGVSGCGKRAVYVKTDYDGWVNNTGAPTR